MSLGDLITFKEGPFGNPGTDRFRVLAGTAASINPGEPVAATSITASAVITLATNKPQVGTDWIVGVAQSVSTDTATANGVVDVMDIFAGSVSFLANPNVAATWNTQGKYDALVGSRVLLDKSNGAYTVLATDAAGNGCIVRPLDVSKYPGKVRIAFRRNCNVLAGGTLPTGAGPNPS